MSKEDKEGFTPMPEHRDTSADGERREKETGFPRGGVKVPLQKKEKNLKASVPSPESEEHIVEKKDDDAAESFLGAIVGAVIILGTLIIGGAYLFFQSGYLDSPVEKHPSGAILPMNIQNLPPPPAPPKVIPSLKTTSSKFNMEHSSTTVTSKEM